MSIAVLRPVRLLVPVLLAGLPFVASCASASELRGDPLFDDEVEVAAFPDPFEKTNRSTLRFNQGADRWVFAPITRAYGFAVPAPARRAVRRALANLAAPATFVNDILQLEPRDAAVTLARFGVNTTVGVVGLFDVAEHAGLEEHESDFGQTLALYGMPSGPYLILPLIGPSTARDGTGYLVDFLFRPTTYILTPGAQVMFTSIHEGSVGLTLRDAHADELAALEASSIDYYAALRSAFTQTRNAEIWARREPITPLASAREMLRSLSGASPSGEIGDTGLHGGNEFLETAALQH